MAENQHAFPAAGTFLDKGMTLRDYFAGQALVGLTAAAGHAGLDVGPKEPNDNASVAAAAFCLADAMMIARKNNVCELFPAQGIEAQSDETAAKDK